MSLSRQHDVSGNRHAIASAGRRALVQECDGALALKLKVKRPGTIAAVSARIDQLKCRPAYGVRAVVRVRLREVGSWRTTVVRRVYGMEG